jgi:CubicO group peptidase (beta-lactamase class C family)
VAGNKPVDPYTTLFNLGSIGKIYTFTAVMQLVEQGKLDLNEDINAYLDFKIPATYPEPIIMAHLRSHSAGLDEFFFGTTAPSAEDVLLLGEYLRTHLPRVCAPQVSSRVIPIMALPWPATSHWCGPSSRPTPTSSSPHP